MFLLPRPSATEFVLRHCQQVLLVSLALIMFSISSHGDAAEATGTVRTCLYGVFPYLPVNNLERIHAPIANRFSKILGCKTKVRSRPNFEMFRNTVEEQRYDIIFIQPFGYIRSAADNGYIPVARFVSSGDKDFKGLIQAQFVALASSPIDRMQQLEGRVISMPSADAAVSMLGRAYLNKFGLYAGKNVRLEYYGNHFSCLEQLVIYKSSACVSALPPIKIFESAKQVSLKIIARSQAIPSSLIAVHRRVPEAVRLRLQKDILNWKNTAAGRKLLHKARLRGFVIADDKDYGLVREIWKGLRENE